MDPASYARTIRAMVRAHARGADTGPLVARLAAQIGLATLATDYATRAGVADAAGLAPLAALPAVPDQAAIESLMRRRAYLAFGDPERVAEIHNRGGFAAAYAADRATAEYVRDTIAASLGVGGGGMEQAVSRIMREADWPRAYSEMVWRTNQASASAAAQLDAASSPAVREVLPAIQYLATRDADVRRGRRQDGGENHLALDGLIAPATWAGWRIWSPPGGYNCRCATRLVPRRELERRGLLMPDGTVPEPSVPSAASFHPNFRGPKLVDFL